MSEVIDHIGIRVGDLPVSRRMYEAALAELGFVVLSEGEFEDDAYVLFGRGDNDDFCLHTVGSKPGRDRVTTGAHFAFRAKDADAVRRWHDAAVRHGGTDIGPPGVRPRSRREQRRGRVPRAASGVAPGWLGVGQPRAAARMSSAWRSASGSCR